MQISKSNAKKILTAQKRVATGTPKTPRNRKPRKK